MPRSVEEILAQADSLAERFEKYEPRQEDEDQPTVVLQLREAVAQRSAVEKQLVNAISQARREGMSWRSIGSLIGVSGEAARQKYASLVTADV